MLTHSATAVAHGRVTKASPSAKRAVKQEQVEDTAFSGFDDSVDAELN